MKSIILSSDAEKRLDPPPHDLLRKIPNLTHSLQEADVAVVLVTRLSNYRFNEDLRQLKKPWVLVDFCEQGWNWPAKISVQFGRNFMQHGSCDDIENPEWRKFDDFVRQNPPILRFHRELLQQDCDETTLPIEYGNFLPEMGMSTKEEFQKRALDVSYIWGRSSEYRMSFQAAIFSEASALGYDVITQFDHLEKACPHVQGPKWAAIHAPHYSRIDVKEVQRFVQKSRVTVSMGGCGQKCFRHSENSEDAILAIPRDRLAWAYPWTEENSIVLPEIKDDASAREAVHVLRNALMRVDLYDLYARGVANGRNYRAEQYARRWIAGNIEKHL